jgi:hypothetical protein
MEAAIKFLDENQHKRSIDSDAGRLRVLVQYIGKMPLDSLHMGNLQPFIEGRFKDQVKTRTINHGLKIVRRICNLEITSDNTPQNEKLYFVRNKILG